MNRIPDYSGPVGPTIQPEDFFLAYPKTPRLFRGICVSEKIDGTNAQICVEPRETLDSALSDKIVATVNDFHLLAGSRTRWITPSDDSYDFTAWVKDNAEDLVNLGPGRHFGEWYGRGIQRNYGLAERRFALFNVARWADGAKTAGHWEKKVWVEGVPQSPRPSCCDVVPVLYSGPFSEIVIHSALESLGHHGSKAVPGFMKPEGIIVYHTAANRAFKVLLENDEQPKGVAE